jgi:hypothetical protein
MWDLAGADDFVIAKPAALGGERLCAVQTIGAATVKFAHVVTEHIVDDLLNLVCPYGLECRASTLVDSDTCPRPTTQVKCYGDGLVLNASTGAREGCQPVAYEAAPQHSCGPGRPCHRGWDAETTRRSVFCEIAPMAAARFTPSVFVSPHGYAVVSGIVDVRPVVTAIEIDGAEAHTVSKAGGADVVIRGRGLIDWQTQLEIDVGGYPCEVTRLRPDPWKVGRTTAKCCITDSL